MAPILVLDPAIEPAGAVGTVTVLREALQVQQGVLEYSIADHRCSHHVQSNADDWADVSCL